MAAPRLDHYWLIANEVLDAAKAALDETQWGAPSRSYVAIGVPAHDDCCEGQLTVSMPRIYPSDRFPDSDRRPIVCGGAQTAVELEVEVVRCAPTFDDNGTPPSVALLMESARQQAYEKRAIWLAVQCLLVAHRDVWSAIVREHVDITPEGMCAGSTLRVTVGFVDGCGCTEG
jgi:hypothetical protein